MVKKQTKKPERNRQEIIFALAQHAHPTWYHSLLNKPTEALRALLEYYERAEKEESMPQRATVIAITFDTDWIAIRSAHPDMVVRDKTSEYIKNKQQFAK